MFTVIFGITYPKHHCLHTIINFVVYFTKINHTVYSPLISMAITSFKFKQHLLDIIIDKNTKTITSCTLEYGYFMNSSKSVLSPLCNALFITILQIMDGV